MVVTDYPYTSITAKKTPENQFRNESILHKDKKKSNVSSTHFVKTKNAY